MRTQFPIKVDRAARAYEAFWASRAQRAQNGSRFSMQYVFGYFR